MSDPERTCIGCRRRRHIDALVRLTLCHRGGAPIVTVDGPSSGRGAWLCRADVGDLGGAPIGGARSRDGTHRPTAVVDNECRRTALERKAFGRAWRTVVGEDVVALIQQLPGSSVS